MQTAPRSESTGKPAGYPDLRQHLATLEARGLLYRITEPVDKDSELHPLVRWQYRGGIPERERKAFLFEHVVDGHGRKFDFPVVVGALAATPEIYAVGLGCTVEEVPSRWAKAMSNPIEPIIVESGPVHENVLTGDALTAFGGLTAIPCPISTPGFDNGPYLTAGHFISRSPATGERNVGNYRGMIKGPTKLAVFPNGPSKGLWRHWEEAFAKGEPIPCAVVVGCTPAVSYAAVQQIPHGMDELAVAGGLAGEPIQLVKCVTIPLEVPAEAELVIEGYVRIDVLEPEGPYGESHGYVHPRTLAPYIDVTAITYRNGMIFSSMISQVTPSESSVVKKVGYEARFLGHLRDYLGIKPVKRVYMHEPLTNLRKFLVIQMHKPSEHDVWRALMAAATFDARVGKILIAVDDDIDPENLDAVVWALCYRMRPDRDVQIISGRNKGHAPPFHKPDLRPGVQVPGNDAAMLINATLKEPYPPISLPKRQYMERARALWERIGLPPLKPESPWFGQSLGDWNDELDEEAEMAARGDYLKVAEKLFNMRQYTKDGARPQQDL